MKPDPKADAAEVLADLARVKALFQARTIAAILGAPPPKPEDFKR